MIPVVKENERPKLELNISTSAPITVLKEILDTPPPVADKIIKILSNNQRQQCIHLFLNSSVLFQEFLHKNKIQFC